MKLKYHIWIFLGLVFAGITAISFWGKWAAIVVAFIIFYIFSRYCLPTWWYIYGKKPKNKSKKYPKKMKYLYWSKDDNGKPVTKAIEEKELKESQ